MTCTVRLFDDPDGLLCDEAHHPAHTFSSTSCDVGLSDGQHG